VWWGGRERYFVPFGVLGGLWLGADYLWADGYIEVARPYCSGVTPEGCSLRWQDVPLEGGDSMPQCVQYCPRAGVAPPTPRPAVVAPEPASPAAPAGGACLIDIYAESNYGGRSDETDEDQPELGDWNKAISSVEVKSGNWSFFTEPDYKGDVMRLAPGKYGDLGSKWNRQAGSFMCLDR